MGGNLSNTPLSSLIAGERGKGGSELLPGGVSLKSAESLNADYKQKAFGFFFFVKEKKKLHIVVSHQEVRDRRTVVASIPWARKSAHCCLANAVLLSTADVTWKLSQSPTVAVSKPGTRCPLREPKAKGGQSPRALLGPPSFLIEPTPSGLSQHHAAGQHNPSISSVFSLHPRHWPK